MKILLLGATGYLGGNIAKKLASTGYDVTCAVRGSSDTSRLRCLPVKFVSCDPLQIDTLMGEEKFDTVINCICVYRPDDSLYENMIKANLMLPLEVLNLAIKHGVKGYMTMGSGLPDDFNIYSFTKNKLSEFGKYLSEKDGINFADLKLEMFYGGDNEPENRFLKNVKLKLLENAPIPLTSGSQKRDIVQVTDIVNIIDLLLKTDYVQGFRELPIGSGENRSIKEIVTFMKTVLNSSSELCFGDVPERNGEPDTLADISWLGDIGYKISRSFLDGLKQECLRTEYTQL